MSTPTNKKTGELFEELAAVIKKLRDPVGGCPWDLKQTHETLRQYLIEEAHEVVQAITEEPEKLSDELGDVLLQIMLHSQIASEKPKEDPQHFAVDTVIQKITTKMIERHPHVFGNTSVKNADQVLENWERIKQKKLEAGKSVLDGVPKMLPALQRAQRTSEKAARIGFEWNTVEEIRDKVSEELKEFLETCFDKSFTEAQQKDEFGDMFFALVQLARRMGYEAEDLLNQSTNKFTRRFKHMESLSEKPLAELSLEKMDQLWNLVKSGEKN